MTASGKHIALIGASGGIGGALLQAICAQDLHQLYAFARRIEAVRSGAVMLHPIVIDDEASIAAAAAALPEGLRFDMILVATGLLHAHNLRPEKAISEMSAEAFATLFAVNATAVALIAKHFLPKLATDRRAVFAALSARVGSISDNRTGGWYAYRASKAALNMIIKNLSIEFGRRHKQAILVGLHPGTVATRLSEPFSRNVPPQQLFTPQQSAQHLLHVLEQLEVQHSGRCFAWDGQEILP